MAYQEFPKMLKRPGGARLVVLNESQQAEALEAGWLLTLAPTANQTQDRSEADRRVHTPEAAGSIPAPATTPKRGRPAKPRPTETPSAE